MRILDVGCGVGGPALTIAAHTGAHVTGVDLVSGRVAIAMERASDPTDFVVGDMLDLPFDDNSFDGAYSFEAICHVPTRRVRTLR